MTATLAPLDELAHIARVREAETDCVHLTKSRCECRRKTFWSTLGALLWAWDRGLIRLPEETP